jgi:hypothetical protein
MSYGRTIERYAERELKYRLRGEIAKEIRKGCPKGNPMVTGITVMLGTALLMAAFNAALKGDDQGWTR